MPNKPDNNIAYMTVGMSASQMTTMNHFLGIAISKWIKASKRMIDWAIFMPHTRLGLYIIFYLFFVFSLMFVINPSLKSLMGTLALLIFPMVFISMIIEASHLMKQLKSFAHVFTGKNHRQLKNKILMVIDKNMLISSLMFLLCIGAIIYLFDISFDAKNLSISLLTILIITLCMYPLMLCLNWINMSFSLVIIVFSYAFIIYKVLSWIKSYPDLTLKIPYVVSFLIAALVVRIVTQGIFWQKPMEVLMKRR